MIIPLYNTERYIGDCLDSILAQTFQNFEVIVVDDCSTDSGCAVVESYMASFDGRLTLTHTETNSGGCAVPRNKGLMFSRGEYIYFMDADDFFTKTALDEMYTLAKRYDADVIYCEKNYEINDDGTNLRLFLNPLDKPIKESTLEVEKLEERVDNILKRDIWGFCWRKLVTRKFLLENEITFPNVRGCEDYLWTLNLFFFAKKFLRVPNAVYVRRQNDDSITLGKKSPQQEINLWLNSAVLGLKGLDKTLGKLEFFRNNVPYRYAVLDFVLKKMFGLSFPASLKVSPVAFYEAVRQGFGKNLGEQDVLVAALCSAVNTLMKISLRNSQQFNQFAAQAQAREKQFRQFVAHTQAQYKRFNEFAAQAKTQNEQFKKFVEHTQTQYKRFNQFAAQAQARIAYLEAELQKRQT